MAVLTGPAIEAAIHRGELVIDPPVPWEAGPNSIDLSMGHTLLRYAVRDTLIQRAKRYLRRLIGWAPPHYEADVLDPMNLPGTVEVPLTNGAWVLEPGVLYLGVTRERTYTPLHVPYLDGRSSLGRLGVFAHVTAGRGDVGFDGRWTVELVAVQRCVLRPGSRLFQLTLHTIEGHPRMYAGRYLHDDQPQPSRLYPNTGRKG